MSEPSSSLWLPFAERLRPAGRFRGSYRKGFPEGLVLHYTAGHKSGLVEGAKLMHKTGMLYLIIDGEGNVGQSQPLDKSGYHAGESFHKDFGIYVSRYLVGLEVQCAGMLRHEDGEFRAPAFWKSDKVFNLALVNLYKKRQGNITPGAYEAFTSKQFDAIVRVCLELQKMAPTIFSLDNVFGHDEVSPGRKVDPGGSLGMSMTEFRLLLWMESKKQRQQKSSKMSSIFSRLFGG